VGWCVQNAVGTNCQSRVLHLAKLYFKNEIEKEFSKQKLKEFITCLTRNSKGNSSS
jgi:hypothetical protein